MHSVQTLTYLEIEYMAIHSWKFGIPCENTYGLTLPIAKHWML